MELHYVKVRRAHSVLPLLTAVYAVRIRNVRLHVYEYYIISYYFVCCLICALKPCGITTFSYSKTLVEIHKFECDIDAIKKRTLKEFFRQILEVA